MKLGRLKAQLGWLLGFSLFAASAETAAAEADGPGFEWASAGALLDAQLMQARFTSEVKDRLQVPATDQGVYAGWLDDRLLEAGLGLSVPQYVILVDRSPNVQMVAILWGRIFSWTWIGATRASTGAPGAFEHFATPLGVFEHALRNHDFRAEGTFNRFHIRGYGLRGMRVFDFGWVPAERGWGSGGMGVMRLQMHSTDPDVLEPRLGRAASKGCIRIPASLNTFIDRYGLIDADYIAAEREGRPPWVLRSDRNSTPWPGRYLVVIDSELPTRPDWAGCSGLCLRF